MQRHTCPVHFSPRELHSISPSLVTVIGVVSGRGLFQNPNAACRVATHSSAVSKVKEVYKYLGMYIVDRPCRASLAGHAGRQGGLWGRDEHAFTFV